MTEDILSLLDKHKSPYKLLVNGEFKISSISIISNAKAGDVSYLMDQNSPLLEQLSDMLLIVPTDFVASNNKINYLFIDDPKLAFYRISHLFGNNNQFILDKAQCEKYPGAHIGINCSIGNNVTIHPEVTIRSNTVLGDNVTIESGCVIGSTGLLWTWNEDKSEKVMLFFTGGTEIKANTYLCANVTVVRGACNEATLIGEQVMVAPGSAIGHGCQIGDFTHLANNVTLGGNVKIGKYCFLGSQSCLLPSVSLLEHSVLGASSSLTKPATKAGVYIGTPAKYLKPVSNDLKGIPRSN